MVGLDSMIHWWQMRADRLRELMRRVHVVFVDEAELALATDVDDPEAGVNRLLELGPHTVVVKRGSRGAWMKRRNQERMQTTAATVANVVDPTGAGDAFAGAFMAALSCSPAHGDEYALRLATALASFAVEGVGTSGLACADVPSVQLRMDLLALRLIPRPTGERKDTKAEAYERE